MIDDQLRVSKRNLWFVAGMFLLALAANLISTFVVIGAYRERVDVTASKVVVMEKRVTELETMHYKTIRAIDRLEFNIKNDIMRRGGVYTELP